MIWCTDISAYSNKGGIIKEIAIPVYIITIIDIVGENYQVLPFISSELFDLY